MLLNNTRPSRRGAGKGALATGFGSRSKGKSASKKPQMEEDVAARDYSGAIALIVFNRQSDEAAESKVSTGDESLMWLGYCGGHLGDYKKALDAYEDILKRGGAPADVHLYKACCYYYLQMYKRAEEHALKGPPCPLQNRLLFHISHKQADETKLMVYHQKLSDTKEDQLSLAAIHYLRSHYQEATDIYKRLLLENRDDLALNVYVAMCYYKLDYYDVSLEILAVYLQTHPGSAVAINLKACNHFRLYNGKAAETELKALGEEGTPSTTTNSSSTTRLSFGVARTLSRYFRPSWTFCPKPASIW